VVYEAEQEQPRHKVAPMIMKAGLASPELLLRFEQEFQALGPLQHPGKSMKPARRIRGLGPQPYFAMEFIDSESLIEYAQVKPNVRQRLEIMGKVCEAAHDARQRSIIHRI
jgi:non-specific serine/threonine protein kinase/serine/threonine-protein kinase